MLCAYCCSCSSALLCVCLLRCCMSNHPRPMAVKCINFLWCLHAIKLCTVLFCHLTYVLPLLHGSCAKINKFEVLTGETSLHAIQTLRSTLLCAYVLCCSCYMRALPSSTVMKSTQREIPSTLPSLRWQLRCKWPWRRKCACWTRIGPRMCSSFLPVVRYLLSHSSIHLLASSFMHSFIYPFMHSFIH